MNLEKPAPAPRLTMAGIVVAAFAAAFTIPASAGTVTIDIPSCATPSATASGTSISISCTVVPPPANAPVCTPSASPASLPSSSGTVTLTGNCTNTTASTTYAWTRLGAAVGSGSANTTDAPPANTGTADITYTYNLRACNGADCDSKNTGTVTVLRPSGGGSGPISCTGYSNTVVVDVPIVAGGTPRVITNQFGAFGTNSALVVRLTPAGGNLSSATLVMGEWGTSAIWRFWTLSQTPCDFATAGKTFNVTMFTGPALSANLAPMEGSGVWYINAINKEPRSWQATCNSGDCPMFIELYAP